MKTTPKTMILRETKTASPLEKSVKRYMTPKEIAERRRLQERYKLDPAGFQNANRFNF